MVIASCGSAQPKPSAILTGNLPINGAETIVAGTPVTITVGPVVVSDGKVVTLIAAGSYGPRIYQAAFRRGVARFVLPGKETQQSGLVQLTAVADKAQGTAQMLIQSSNPVEPLTPLIGSRAVIADALHWNMIVVIPFDAFGNPVMEGTQIDAAILHPGDRLEKKLLVVRHLLAWTRVFSGTRAGRTLVEVHIGPLYGFEGTTLEVAGWPVPFDVFADPQPLPADGHLITTLRTASIYDKFGNVMPDGTLITFIIKAPDGTFSTIPAYTINGVAEAPFTTPQQAGTYILQATVLGVESQESAISFTAGLAVKAFPVSVQKDPVNHAYRLRAGPLLGSLGQFVPDGTPVHFIVTDVNGQSQELESIADAGYAVVELLAVQFPAGVYTLQVHVGSGGAMQKVTLK
jgi:hypothetical protein